MSNNKNPSWRLIISCSLGTFLEFFDYTLYGYFAMSISQQFFPHYSPELQWYATWSVFAIGCLVRPFGAFAFGHFADRWGRRKVLPYTILLMAIPTIAIGLLPTYQSWGWLAPSLLLFCRILQGLSLSAEYNGCSVYCVESGWKNPGFIAAITPFSCGIGMLCASGLALWSSHYWRISFVIAGLVVGIVGWIMRRNLPETPEFQQLLSQNNIQKFPFKTLLKHHKFSFLVSIVCSAYMGSASYLLLVYMPSYLQTEFAMSVSHSLQFTILLACLEGAACLYFGWISDRIGQGKTMLWACVGTLLLSLVMLKFSGVFLIFIALLTILLGAFDGPLTLYLPNLFPTELRYSATSIGYNLGAAAIGGLAPVIVSILINSTQQAKLILTVYLAVGAALAGLCILIKSQKISLGIPTEASERSDDKGASLRPVSATARP